MKATYKVWLECTAEEWNMALEQPMDEPFDADLLDEPYWHRLRAILASLDAQGVLYEVVLDNEGDRAYASVHTMPPAAQLSLEDQNVAIP